MKAISFNFQIHQPYRLKRYRFFDIGNDHYYYDDFANDEIIERISRRAYIPACETLLRMIESTKGWFRCSISITGVALEQCEQYVPELIDLLKRLADTGKVEFLSETYDHSLASLIDPEDFRAQVKRHDQKIKELFGVTPKVFRNTEMIYSDEIAPQLVAMGFKGCLTEGAKHILGWKSPNYVYAAASAPKLKLLFNNAKLSDDIAFRFSNHDWDAYPLTADKYIDWIAQTPAEEQIVNLCLNLETFGERHPAETGIFQFLEALPRFAKERGLEFRTPGEVVGSMKPVDVISVVHAISWADEARDTSAWLGNKLQQEAFDKLYSVGERVRLCTDRRIHQDWHRLQSADHFYYMSTKQKGDGVVHSAFSPYETAFQAFTNYMNVLADFMVRVNEQYPVEVENEELNSLVTTIRNQAREIEMLQKSLETARLNQEHLDEEHKLREKKEPEVKKAPAKKAAPKAPKAETVVKEAAPKAVKEEKETGAEKPVEAKPKAKKATTKK